MTAWTLVVFLYAWGGASIPATNDLQTCLKAGEEIAQQHAPGLVVWFCVNKHSGEVRTDTKGAGE